MSKELEKSLIEVAKRLLTPGSVIPTNVWHPEFEWIVVDGKPTDTTDAFLDSIVTKIANED